MNQSSMFPEMEPAPDRDLFAAPASAWIGSRIILHRGERAWFARFTGPDSARMVELFGTNDICTGFLADADPEEVHAKIARLNPEYLVVIEDL